MKRILLCILCILLFGGVLSAENLIENADFGQNFAGWWSNSKLFSVHEEAEVKELWIYGDPVDEQYNQRLIRLLPGIPSEQIAGHDFTLSFKSEIRKLSGALRIAIRQIDSGGKSLGYHTVRFCKYDRHDWQEFRKSYKMSTHTVQLAIYISADYLAGDDLVKLKELKLSRD